MDSICLGSTELGLSFERRGLLCLASEFPFDYRSSGLLAFFEDGIFPRLTSSYSIASVSIVRTLLRLSELESNECLLFAKVFCFSDDCLIDFV